VLTRQHGAEPLGVLTGPANRPLRDRRGLFAALDGAASSVTVTWARWDIRSGGDLYPTPVLAGPLVHHGHVASHAAQLTSATAPWLDADEWFTRDASRITPRLARRRRAITARAQGAPGEFDGQVGDLGAMHPFRRLDTEGRPAQVGITSFEEWVRCGLEYFVTRVLGARTDDLDPSDITDIEPQRKGTLIHRVFERLIGEWIEANPGTDRAWVASPADVQSLAQRAEELLDDEAAQLMAEHRLGHPEMWRARRNQIVTAIRRGLELELRDPVTPLEVEFAFGRRSDGAELPAVFTSPDGEHVVHFSGAIDRLDRLPDGSLRVMDLKSGLATSYKGINALDPLGPKRDRLQLAFYGWAVQQLREQPVTGAMYRFVGRPDAGDDVVLELTDDVHEQLHARLGEIAAGIHEGRFVPGEVGTFGCPACAPDKLGTFEMNQRLVEWNGELEVVEESA
jgi:ATP-dependent helicase/nuclease subunit B